jgi:hypothetical protein
MFNKPQDFINAWKRALSKSQKENEILLSRNTTLADQVSTQAEEIAMLKQKLKLAGLA